METASAKVHADQASTLSAGRSKSQKRKLVTMSTPNPGTAPSGPTPVTIEKTYKYFDLDTFQEVAEKASVTFTPSADSVEALARIQNDSVIMTRAINAYLQRQAFAEKRREIQGKGASRKVVLSVIKPLRELPPAATMERKAQTEFLLDQVRKVPFMLEAIKQASMAALAADADLEDDGDDD